MVNLLEWIKKDPERLAREIYYTPYARQIYDNAYTQVPEDSLQQAVNFLIRLNMGHGFRTTGERVGWKNDIQGRERAYAAKDWCSLPDRIIQAAERLRGVQIEHRPAVDLMGRFNHPKSLIYLDPPYVIGSRSGSRKQYNCEMSDADHEILLDKCLKHTGPLLISGYDSDIYRDALRGWQRKEHISRTQTGAKATEVLWINYDPPEKQISIFD